MFSTVLGYRIRAYATCLLLGAPLWAQDPSAERIQSLERKIAEQARSLRDYGGQLRYGSDNTELPEPAAGENRVVFFGDQITEFWGRGETPLFPGKPWLNRGIAGQTTDQMLVRFRQDVISLHPKVVVILGGLNDIAGVHGVSPEETILDNLISMAELARVNGIRVVLASVTPVCDCFTKRIARQRWLGRIRELNQEIREYSANNGIAYLDYYAAMARDGELKSELTVDGVIPNDAGYGVMATLARKVIAEVLK